MRVLSLFDGMACGMIAFTKMGIEIESYDAYEIDKYAIKTATHNFPIIKERGDVFTADFTKYKGVDFVVGGSPCTYWSIAQKNNRETEASGMGWELFSQYVRAIKEAEPKYFIYENNYSMSAAIRESIDKAFGFSAVYINSALVSAQNRQRLYWVGKRNADGSYSKVDVKQPKDRGILLRDILEREAYRIPEYGNKDKGRPLNALYPNNCGGFEHRIWNANPSKQQVDMIAEPVCMRYERSPEAKRLRKKYELGEIKHGFREYAELHPRTDGKTNTLSTVLKDNPILEPICSSRVVAMLRTDGKGYKVYEVCNGIITINGKQYPIKLADGYYVIRKLTVTECKRLQTVPEWYEFPVSNAQAYKMLGNGWTVDVIAHLIKAALTNQTIKEEMEQISIFDVV